MANYSLIIDAVRNGFKFIKGQVKSELFELWLVKALWLVGWEKDKLSSLKQIVYNSSFIDEITTWNTVF